MAQYSVTCERSKSPTSAKTTWQEHVSASSETEARDIAKQKAKAKYPSENIVVGSAKKIG